MIGVELIGFRGQRIWHPSVWGVASAFGERDEKESGADEVGFAGSIWADDCRKLLEWSTGNQSKTGLEHADMETYLGIGTYIVWVPCWQTRPLAQRIQITRVGEKLLTLVRPADMVTPISHKSNNVSDHSTNLLT